MIGELTATILQALLNAVWQGTVVAVVIYVILRFHRNCNAASLYFLWFSTLVFIALLPLFPLLTSDSFHAKLSHAAAAGTVASSPGVISSVPVLFLTPRIAIFLLAAIAGIIVFRTVWVFRGWLRLRLLKRESEPLPEPLFSQFLALKSASNCRRVIQGRISKMIHVPAAAGFFQPMVLIPKDVIELLNGEESDHVLLHEISHLRRFDDWTQFAQKLIEAVFFFHPAVLCIGHCLDLQREIASDDEVVLATGGARKYAASLTRLVELSGSRQRPMLSPGAIPKRSHLYRRVDMLLKKNRSLSPSISRSMLAAAFIGAAILLATVVQVSPVLGVSLTERTEWRQAQKQMFQAEKEMTKAESEIWKAAEAQRKAVDEKGWRDAKEEMRAARLKIAKARRQMRYAKVQMHMVSDQGYLIQDEMSDAIHDGIEGSIEDAVKDGIEGSMEDGLKEGFEGLCPEQQKQLLEMRKKAMRHVRPMAAPTPPAAPLAPAREMAPIAPAVPAPVAAPLPPAHEIVAAPPETPAPPAPRALHALPAVTTPLFFEE